MNREWLRDTKKNLSFIHQIEPAYIPLLLIITLLRRTEPFVEIILGAQIVDMLAVGEDFALILRKALIMVGVGLALRMLEMALEFCTSPKGVRIADLKNKNISDKAMKMDFEILEKNSTLEQIAKARQNSDVDGGLGGYCNQVVSLAGCFFSVIVALITLGGLADAPEGQGGGVLYAFFSSRLSVILIFLFIGLNVFWSSKIEEKIGKINYKANNKNAHSSRLYWFFFNLISQYTIGKDIRIFHMRELIESEGRSARREIEQVNEETVRAELRLRFLSAAVEQGFMLAAYIFVGVRAILGLISIGGLSKYVSTIFMLQSAVSTLFVTITRIRSHNRYLADYTDFMEIRNLKYEGTLPVEKRLDHEYELEFRNVSFRYPNHDRMILKNISFRFRIKSRLAIVGPNGAGKTTFIKLLCRLYDPTEGEILLNGINIKKYDYDEYIRLFSVVFQDYNIFSFSVAENVASSHAYDEERVAACLKEAGLYERVAAFPKGIHTKLLKDQTEDGDEGVEISGGEKQKLALARALYRDAPLVILDEPTSALDPIAEQDIYQRFSQMVKDKTAVFISHRMSSCKLCDQILVFRGGEIVQMGSHEELLRDADGLYREMWNAQAQYYV